MSEDQQGRPPGTVAQLTRDRLGELDPGELGVVETDLTRPEFEDLITESDVVDRWAATDGWPAQEQERIARLVCSENARRVYGLEHRGGATGEIR